MSHLKWIQHRPEEAYTRRMRTEMYLLSVDAKQMAIPFGSAVYRLQEYPSDLDLLEEINSKHDKKTTIRLFREEIQNVVKRIHANPYHYYSEIKVGLDQRYNIDFGNVTYGKWYPSSDFVEKVTALYKGGLITKKDYELIRIAYKEKTVNNYEVIFKILRKYRQLRWTADEIIDGRKWAIDEYIYLEQAINTPRNLIKVDEITILNGELTEVTNVFFLSYSDKSNIETADPMEKYFKNIYYPINGPAGNVQKQLREEIAKLYYSDMYYSPFKMVKRMFALSANVENKTKKEFQNIIRELRVFVTSTTSMLYKLKSELETIKLVLERVVDPPEDLITRQLDNMKYQICSYMEIPQDKLTNILKVIDYTVSADNPDDKIEYIDVLISGLKKYINESTIRHLNILKLNPPPRFMLPEDLKYDFTMVRTPESNPVNPMELVEKGLSGSGLSNTDHNPTKALSQLIHSINSVM